MLMAAELEAETFPVEISPPYIQDDESRSWLGKIGNTASARKIDYEKSVHPLQTRAWGALALSTQVVGFTKLTTLFGPGAAMKVLDVTHSPVATGAAIGTAIGAWTFGVAKTMNRSATEFPATYESAAENFPALVNFGSKALPGYKPVADNIADESSKSGRVSRFFARHGSRGFTAAALSTSGYVVTARLQNRSQNDMRRLNRTLALDSGAVTGIITGGATEVIVSMANSHPQLAETIQQNLGNGHLGLGLAIGMIGVQWRRNKTAPEDQAVQANN
jgi:hypothetical protein